MSGASVSAVRVPALRRRERVEPMVSRDFERVIAALQDFEQVPVEWSQW